MKSVRLWKIGALAIALGLSSTSLATTLVVRSSGSSAKLFPPGKALPDSAKIQLQPGDSVMLLNAKGARTLRGPGTFAVASAGGGSLATAAARRERTASMRSAAVPLNPSPSKLTLWRPQKEDSIKLTIRGGGGEQTLDWAAGADTIAWPASLPVTSGAEYQLSQPGSGDSARVTFVTLSNPPGDAVGTAQSLIANGCNNQLDVLVEATPDMN